MKKSSTTARPTQHRLVRTGDRSPHRRHQRRLQGLRNDRLAGRLCSRPQRPVDRDGATFKARARPTPARFPRRRPSSLSRRRRVHEKMVTEFDRRRRVIVEGLNAMPGVSCSMPGGAFYAFPNSGCPWEARSDRPGQLTDGPRELSTQERDRGRSGRAVWEQQHIRLSYATSMDTITNGLKRLRGALEQLK